MLDNLSYRLDQNGPYNTVYAAKSIPFSSISPDATYANAKVIPSGVQQNLQTPTVESWNLKIERKLFANTTLGVGYVGSHGYHELLSWMQICPRRPFALPRPAPRDILQERFIILLVPRLRTTPCGTPPTGSPKGSVPTTASKST